MEQELISKFEVQIATKVCKVRQRHIYLIGDDSDDEQFEVGADGKIRLKPGKKKIDLDKLTDDDLRRLGIDPTLSKAEIARRLKVTYYVNLYLNFSCE